MQADPVTFIERLPEQLWPWVPLLLTVGAVAVVVLTIALSMWLVD